MQKMIKRVFKLGNNSMLNASKKFLVVLISLVFVSCRTQSLVFDSYRTQQMHSEAYMHDELTGKDVYSFVDQMPVYKGESFVTDFIQNFHPDDSMEWVSFLRLQFVITKSGKLVGARILDKKMCDLTPFEQNAVKTVESLQKWDAGRLHGKKVNVLITQTFKIDPNH